MYLIGRLILRLWMQQISQATLELNRDGEIAVVS